MHKDTTKDWRELCKKAAKELDPERLLELIVQINDALDEHAKKRKASIEGTIDSDPERKSQLLSLACANPGLSQCFGPVNRRLRSLTLPLQFA